MNPVNLLSILDRAQEFANDLEKKAAPAMKKAAVTLREMADFLDAHSDGTNITFAEPPTAVAAKCDEVEGKLAACCRERGIECDGAKVETGKVETDKVGAVGDGVIVTLAVQLILQIIRAIRGTATA
jgi:hypothetical protein